MIYAILAAVVIALILSVLNYLDIKELKNSLKQQKNYKKELLKTSKIEDNKSEFDNSLKNEIDLLVSQIPSQS